MKRKPSFVADDEWIELRVPLPQADEAELVFTYSNADPLVVDISVRCADDAIALTRTILRSDLVRVTAVPDLGVSVPMHARDVVIVPENGARLRLVMREGHARVEEAVPTDQVRRFLRATERLVPYEDETEVVDRLIHVELASDAGPEATGRT